MSKKIVQIIILQFLLISFNSFAQDSLKVKKDSTTGSIIILSQNKYSYINQSSPDTITRKRFLWYPFKTIDDLFNYFSGYSLEYMDAGQVNQLRFNQLDHHYTALMRNGRPINDLLDGSLDFNLLSRNEIEEIELTNGYGNFLYNYSNGINIINHQVFRYKPYSEISFVQDRFENLYFDGTYHQNIFNKLNFNFGITKNSYDGKYINSDFDKWQGRFNVNFFPSSKVNSFLSINYSKIKRGLNEGIDPFQTPLNKTSLFDVALAIVRNPDAYETRERFDIDWGLIYAYGKKRNSFTKLQLFTTNSFRMYRDEENRPTPNGILFKDNSHWITYGAKLQQVLNYKISKGFELISYSEIEYDKDLITSNIIELRKSDRIYLMENVNLSAKYFNLNAYAKAYKLEYFGSKFFSDYSIKPEIKFDLGKLGAVSLYGIYSKSNKLPSYQQYYLDKYLYGHNVFPHTYEFKNEDVSSFIGGTSVKFSFGKLKFEYYSNSIKNPVYNIIQNGNSIIGGRTSFENSGLNANLGLKAFHFELELNASHDLSELQGNYNYLPKTSGIASLVYHNIFFKNKLEVKIGVVSRFWTDFYAGYYSGFYNDFDWRVIDTTHSLNNEVKIKSNATLDFFIIGKINKATFGLTFENLLNRLYITSGIYPYQNRGGLLNVISRFNITWYFLN